MRRTRPYLIVCCCLGACGIAACNGGLSPEAQRLLDSGKLSYQRGDDVGAVRSMTVFLRDNARSSRAEEAYYYRGLARYRAKDLPGAKADFQQALGRTREKAVKVGSMVALGDLAYDTGDLGGAERMYAEVLRDIDESKKPADQVRYRLGCTLQKAGRWQEADLNFDRVLYHFPGTELARRSSDHVRCRAWTIQIAVAGAKPKAQAAAADAAKRTKLRADVQSIERGGKLVFLVCLGRYGTFDKAQADLPAVRRQYTDAFITATR